MNINRNINKIIIVTSFAYQPNHDPNSATYGKFFFTDEKQEQNVIRFTKLLHKLLNNIHIPIKICSNKNIDRDLCYCVFAKYFIPSTGGFSSLMEELNNLNKK